MSLINYTAFLNIFKKRFKLFIYLNLIFCIFFVFCNQTIFKEKLSKKYSVIFDFEYDYLWSGGNAKHFEFDALVTRLSYQAETSEDSNFPFVDLKKMHSTYFSLLYEFNHNDIKGMDFKSEYNKIGRSFNFDSRNVTYRNKKLHIGWDDLKEAEDYLLSLHTRSIKTIESVLIKNLNDKENFIKKKINDFLNIYSLNDLRKNIAIVPQEAFLFTSTISENLKFGDPKASKNLVKASATKAGLIDDVNNFPKGFKTLVGERGITLSGGQRQRAALGRALLINAPVIVLDDALASVDNKTASIIINEIRKNNNKTIIMISHQLAVAATCDRVLVMDKGQIVQEGTHKYLLEKNGLYKNLWERELAVKSLQK